MKLAIESPVVLLREKTLFQTAASLPVLSAVPNRRVMAYLNVLDELSFGCRSLFRDYMFKYAAGTCSPGNLEEGSEVEKVVSRWRRECGEIAASVFESRLLGRRGRGFLERSRPKDVFRWIEASLVEFQPEALRRSDRGAERGYRIVRSGLNIDIVCRWEHHDLPVVLWAELDSCCHEKVVYVPLHLSLGCWRMEWDECGILTEGSAGDVLTQFLNDAEQTAAVLSEEERRSNILK